MKPLLSILREPVLLIVITGGEMAVNAADAAAKSGT